MMSNQRFNTIRFTTLGGLLLIFALSAAWAVEYYSASKVYQLGHDGEGFVIKPGADRVRARARANALDDYLTEKGLTEVEITTEMIEEFIEIGDGTSYYALNFIFGPSGTYFAENKPFKLRIVGKYVNTPCDVWLYDENGEALEGTRRDDADQIIFDIPHFSSYTYDHYDEY
jgi:hypothetical protein